MRKLKNFIALCVGTIIIVSIIALALNFIVVPKVQAFYTSNRTFLDNTLVEQAKLELPMAVLRNLEQQVDSDKVITDKHIEAFEKNKASLCEILGNMNVQYSLLEENFEALNIWSLGRHATLIDEMHMLLTSLEATTGVFLPKLSNTTLDAIHNEALEVLLTDQEEDLMALATKGKALELEMANDVALVVNIIVVALIVVLFLLSYVLIRYVRGDLKYMMRSLEIISKRQYTSSELTALKPFFDEEEQMMAFVTDVVNQKKFATEIRDIVSKCYLIDEVIEVLFEKLQERMFIDRLGIAFVDYDKGKITAEHSVLKNGILSLSTGFEQDISSSSLRHLIQSGEPIIIDNLEAAFHQKPTSPSLALLRKEGMYSNMAIPIKIGQAVFGILFFSSRSQSFFGEQEKAIGEDIVDEIAPLLNKSYFTKIIFTRITSSFSELVEGKDASTGEHIERMVRYGVLLANGVRRKHRKGYELSERDVLDLERHASSHDIGKVAIPDAILKKPGKLTKEEWDIMKTHATVGADIFKHLREGLMRFDPEFFKTAEDIARSHHERWDGTGYPLGLSGESIPLVGRIVAIADVFDALTTKRVYKDAFSFEKAVEIILEGSGNHFDPFLVEVFVENLPSFKAIYMSK